MPTTTTSPIKVWVGCLSCYNEGRLTGAWVTADGAADFIPCDRPGHEEFWCLDVEDPYGFITEECSPAYATRVVQALADLSLRLTEADWGAIAAYWNDQYTGLDFPDGFDEDAFLDAYLGRYNTFREFADDLAEDLLGVARAEGAAEILTRYFDYAAWARDLEYDYSVVEVQRGQRGVYIFQY